MRIVQKGKGIRYTTSNPTDELDRFIRRVQIRSRVIREGKILRMEPLRETIEFDLTPSENNCKEFYSEPTTLICRSTI